MFVDIGYRSSVFEREKNCNWYSEYIRTNKAAVFMVRRGKEYKGFIMVWIVLIVLRKSAGRKGFGVEMVGKQRIKGLFTYFLIMDSMDSFEKVSW